MYKSCVCGGHDMENESEQLLVGGDYYMDLAYILRLALPEQILRMSRNHGIDKILFATDSPWHTPSLEKRFIATLGLSEGEKELIYHENAERLLGIKR